ncbi:MAG TPA: S8 family serine peptidase [Gaiellaceae bacterium]|nr:S8 family serine peptidase [Gaiellaceae bacterium]
MLALAAAALIAVVAAASERAGTGTAAVASVTRTLPLQPVSRLSRAAPTDPDDPLSRDAWALAKARLPEAWRRTTGRPDVVVAVLDTGVELSHPDLAGAFVPGYDFVNGDADPSDDHGHGTMVAGVVAARSNNSLGVAGACGRCSIMPVKVIGSDGRGRAADVAAGIVWAADHGARLMNLSFTLSGPDEAVERALEHARDRDVLVVAGAGNTGAAEAAFPAAYAGVIGVAGSDPDDARYAWSSDGGWVGVAAPGCSPTTAPGGGYGEFCGTSSATALVSGIAALLRSLAPARPAGDVAHALAATAAPASGYVAAGRVDAAAAAGTLQPPRS